MLASSSGETSGLFTTPCKIRLTEKEERMPGSEPNSQSRDGGLSASLSNWFLKIVLSSTSAWRIFRDSSSSLFELEISTSRDEGLDSKQALISKVVGSEVVGVGGRSLVLRIPVSRSSSLFWIEFKWSNNRFRILSEIMTIPEVKLPKRLGVSKFSLDEVNPAPPCIKSAIQVLCGCSFLRFHQYSLSWQDLFFSFVYCTKKTAVRPSWRQKLGGSEGSRMWSFWVSENSQLFF